jgi:hypothetical protein
MDKAVGYTCPKCKEILFGLTLYEGAYVLYSNCTCGGESHFRVLSLATAKMQLDDLNDESKKFTETQAAFH